MPKQKKAEAPKEAPKKASKRPGTWARNYYIRDFGHVKVGDAVTEESMAAWNARSESKPQLED